MVASRPWNAALMRASCWTQAGYSSGVRPYQIGSPMMRTGRPGWASVKDRRTAGMIRPGLRPGLCHVDPADLVGGRAEFGLEQLKSRRRCRHRHGPAGSEALGHERQRALRVLLLGAVQERGVRERLRPVSDEGRPRSVFSLLHAHWLTSDPTVGGDGCRRCASGRGLRREVVLAPPPAGRAAEAFRGLRRLGGMTGLRRGRRALSSIPSNELGWTAWQP